MPKTVEQKLRLFKIGRNCNIISKLQWGLLPLQDQLFRALEHKVTPFRCVFPFSGNFILKFAYNGKLQPLPVVGIFEIAKPPPTLGKMR